MSSGRQDLPYVSYNFLRQGGVPGFQVFVNFPFDQGWVLAKSGKGPLPRDSLPDSLREQDMSPTTSTAGLKYGSGSDSTKSMFKMVLSCFRSTGTVDTPRYDSRR